ncbi:MAG TPA: HAMP domain-containing sensor histidine kinase [Rhizomicrobium sp.]|jgi:signal transduction histidine kinase|nr:HAMP domain-containing sensor histidine kinase [Rhizomicrobium sp.]
MRIDWRKKAAALFFPSRPGWIVDVSGVLLVLVGCTIDLSTNPAYSPLPFFVLPIIYVAWFSPHRTTSWICIALMTTSDLVVAYSDDFRISTVEAYSVVTQIATVILVYWTLRRLRASALDLRDAKVRLESLNREKDLLFGVISHDLRGALGVMLASSRLLTRRGGRPTDEQLQMIANNTEATAEKSLVVLEDLLEWSRLQLGGAVVTPQPVAIAPVVCTCVEAAAQLAGEKRVQLIADNVSGSLTALADERALRVVLRNLIGNALKFTGEGGTVKLAAWAADGQCVICVKDSGTGIAEEKLQQLISGNASSSSRGVRGETGTGFGLSMCKDILRRFEGRLDAKSVVGQGSEFFVRLPCAENARAAAAA